VAEMPLLPSARQFINVYEAGGIASCSSIAYWFQQPCHLAGLFYACHLRCLHGDTSIYY
jgi:hypothetical protein